MDKVTVGIVGTVFSMMYGICVPFAGITADIFNRKWMITIGVGVFSLGIFFSGWVSSVGALIITYGILNGIGQTFYYPSATSIISQLHVESRATAMSILQLGLYVGIVGCGALAGLVAGRGGEVWRVPYWGMGAMGVVWSVLLALLLRNTKPSKGLGGSQGEIIERPSIKEAIMSVLSKPTAVCIILGLAMMIYVDIGFKIWMPVFLRENFMEKVPSLARWYGLHAVCWHYLGAMVGVLIGSRAGDHLAVKRPVVRLETGIIGFAGAIPFIIGMANTSSIVGCCGAMLGFGFFRGIYDSNFIASFFEVVPARYHASGIGIMMGVAFLFGSLSSTILPWLSKMFGGDMASSMTSLAGFYFVGMIIVFGARVCFCRERRGRKKVEKRREVVE